MFRNLFYHNNKSLFFLVIFTLLMNLTLWAHMEQIFPEIDTPVAEMQFPMLQNWPQYSFITAIPGNGGGLGCYDQEENFEIFNFSTNLGAVALETDVANERILVCFGNGSWSDGLYSFDLELQEFQIIEWFYHPNFIKILPSGYYCGYGTDNQGGLAFSDDGSSWESIEYFDFQPVTALEETMYGTRFIAAGNTLYMETGESFHAYPTSLPITDIYLRYFLNDQQVYITCGDGSYSDSLYRVDFTDEEITGLTRICYIYSPEKIFEYMNYLVVGCSGNPSSLYLVSPQENSEPVAIQHDFNIDHVYCFDIFPFINTPNFIAGTNSGIYLAHSLDTYTDEDMVPAPNNNLKIYPNPFRSSSNSRSSGVTISYSVASPELSCVEIYNMKGQKVRSRLISSSTSSDNGDDSKSSHFTSQTTWDGMDDMGNPVSTGIYLAILKTQNKHLGSEKLLIIK